MPVLCLTRGMPGPTQGGASGAPSVTPDGGEAQKASRRGEEGGEERQRDTPARNGHGKGLNLTIQTHLTDGRGKGAKPRKRIHRLPRRFFLNLSEARSSPADLEGVKRLPGCVSPRVQPPRDPRPVSARPLPAAVQTIRSLHKSFTERGVAAFQCCDWVLGNNGTIMGSLP